MYEKLITEFKAKSQSKLFESETEVRDLLNQITEWWSCDNAVAIEVVKPYSEEKLFQSLNELLSSTNNSRVTYDNLIQTQPERWLEIPTDVVHLEELILQIQLEINRTNIDRVVVEGIVIENFATDNLATLSDDLLWQLWDFLREQSSS